MLVACCAMAHLARLELMANRFEVMLDLACCAYPLLDTHLGARRL